MDRRSFIRLTLGALAAAPLAVRITPNTVAGWDGDLAVATFSPTVAYRHIVAHLYEPHAFGRHLQPMGEVTISGNFV